MKLFKTNAIIIRSRPLGESDRLLTLLTRERGKINAVAKGARKTKSKLAAGVDLFVHGQYVLFQGKTLATITQQEIIESFPCLKEEPAAYAYAFYFAELVERILMEGERNTEIYQLLLEGMRSLETGKDYYIQARAFELKLLSLNGYRPYFPGCICCNSEENNYFSSRLGGLICRKCLSRDPRSSPFAAGSFSLVEYFLTHTLLEAGVIRASSSQKQELYDFTTGLMQHYLELEDCKSLKYIRRYFPGNNKLSG